MRERDSDGERERRKEYEYTAQNLIPGFNEMAQFKKLCTSMKSPVKDIMSLSPFKYTMFYF